MQNPCVFMISHDMELLFYMELAHWVQLRIGKDYEAKCF